MQEYTFTIPSMHNETSAKELSNAVCEISGVQDVDVNYEEGILTVFYDDNKVNVDSIKTVLGDLGYGILNV